MITNQRFIQGIAACGILALLSGCSTNGDAFTKLDMNHDGSGSPQEFDAYMKREVFIAADTNRDGNVSRQEWQNVNPKVNTAGFGKVDRNGNGAINRTEADATFDRERSLNRLYKQIDTDGNGRLSHAEVSAFRLNQQQPVVPTNQRIIHTSTRS